MSSHYYEVALFGEFYPQDLSAVMNRITLHSESAHPMHAREIVFEQTRFTNEPPSHRGEHGQEPPLLRARKDLLEPEAKWVLYSYLKPESARVHPRPQCALGLLAGGRQCPSFRFGFGVHASLPDVQAWVDQKTQKPIPAHPDTLWEVEVRTAAPVRNSQETPLSRYIEAVLETQLLMKGLLDLRRKDV
ncbi:uncharacterized protein B0H18DRAFT_1112428 [Fomitopsis serialis]|uniref:uncharacterized protein n=1 Tax=Fomitopsis serialis TaxID=139415 RepID=UPI00200868C7|nr:uncharacterized protein B0H18DRAFT_1112428 [Neoantrodia serialis]KAH9938251.1 hypothetical protein B0H18DRAFT_1112428 [Neoantrodia serialis]